MVYFVIALWGVGLLLIPGGRIYIALERRKPGSRFADSDYSRHVMNFFRMASLIVCCIAMFILFILIKQSQQQT